VDGTGSRIGGDAVITELGVPAVLMAQTTHIKMQINEAYLI
jgi:hypothetical protein